MLDLMHRIVVDTALSYIQLMKEKEEEREQYVNHIFIKGQDITKKIIFLLQATVGNLYSVP